MSRATWTDERLDDFARNTDRRFDEVDRRFDQVDERFNRMEDRLDRIVDRLDSIQHTIAHGAIAMTVGILTGFAAILALIATTL